MRPTPPRCTTRSGFTLLELMVVLVLISLMTAMIVPEMRGTYGDALLRSQSRELVNALNLAYSRSVSINQPHRVRLDKIAGRYFIERRVREAASGSSFAPARDLPDGEGRINPRISIEVRKPGEMLSDPSSQSQPLDSRDNPASPEGDDAITFYPDGTADDREILLEDRDGFRLALQVNPITARIHIVERERK